MSRSSFGFRPSFNSGRKLSRENRKGLTNGRNDHAMHEKRQRSRHDNTEAEKAARSIFGDVPLTDTERRYLWSAQSGNLPALELLIDDSASFNLCCRDYLGRTALQLSLLGEHYDCIQLLLDKLRPDIIEEGLLHAIKANNVKICDMFLSQPLYSDPQARMQTGMYEQEDSSSSFANDITPIVLAAQCNNFDIVHMLIQKGFTISTPHNYFCLCPECQTYKDLDRVVHSKSRLNAYRGLASTAYLSLSCDDPIYAAFELSRNLEKLADREKEHKNEYRGLSNQCKDFAVALLDQCRTNEEVMSALHGGTDTTDLARIKMAIRYDQKKFIAHASCQEQLASMWYSGAPWFQHQSFVIKLLLVPFGILFIPLTAIVYVFVPYSKLGRILKSPFMKFMNYICSYMAFLVLLFLGTQLTTFQSVHLFNGVEGVVNGLIMFYVLGMFWAECKQLWEDGLRNYFSQMWNYMDITMLSLYTAGYSIEGVIYSKANVFVSDNQLLNSTDETILNPQILSKILFSVANVMSFARIAYILPASETFGQLQISYGRMLQDVGKFIFIYVTVMVAFICGLTNLYSISDNTFFSGLSETTGTLFWAAFGLGNSKAPQIVGNNYNTNNNGVGGASGGGSFTNGVKTGGGGSGGGNAVHNNVRGDEVTDAEKLGVVEMIGYILYGVYILGAVVVLINMLIAMMSNTFEEIQKSEDCEWKFARAKLWISFIEQGTTLPIPFNIIPTPKSIIKMTRIMKHLVCCKNGKFNFSYEDSQKYALEYKAVMHRVVLRYIHKMKFDNREESLKDEIIETREEVLYQMHSMLSRLSYRMELVEGDLLAVSKNIQVVVSCTGDPVRANLSYSRSVPSHVRESTSSNNISTMTSSSVKEKSTASTPFIKRGRSYYHHRPKHKLSDNSIQYNNQDSRPCNLSTVPPIGRSRNQSEPSGQPYSDILEAYPIPSPPRSAPIMSDLNSVPSATTSPPTATQHTPIQGHCDNNQGQGHGSNVCRTDLISSGLDIKTSTDVSIISGNGWGDGMATMASKGGQADHYHKRVDSLRLRGSYSPRPVCDERPMVCKRDATGQSGLRWAQEVIEESSFEDQHGPPLSPHDPNNSHSKPFYGSIRRRRETKSHPNIDAPFQPISTDNQRNTFTEYRYQKPKRRETIQNLILDVNSMPLRGMEVLSQSGGRPVSDGTGISEGVSSTRDSRRNAISSQSGSGGVPSGAMSRVNHKDSNTITSPKAFDEKKDSSCFNWAHPFLLFYGSGSQDNLSYYPMQVVSQENTSGMDCNVISGGDSKHEYLQTNISHPNNNGQKAVDDINGDNDDAKTNRCVMSGGHADKAVTSKSLCKSSVTEMLVKNIGSVVDKTLYDATNETSLSVQDGICQKSDITVHHKTLDPLCLSETETPKSSFASSSSLKTSGPSGSTAGSNAGRPVRKIGMVNIENLNPILLREGAFYESLRTADSGTTSCSDNKRDTILNRQKSASEEMGSPSTDKGTISNHVTKASTTSPRSSKANYNDNSNNDHNPLSACHHNKPFESSSTQDSIVGDSDDVKIATSNNKNPETQQTQHQEDHGTFSNETQTSPQTEHCTSATSPDQELHYYQDRHFSDSIFVGHPSLPQSQLYHNPLHQMQSLPPRYHPSHRNAFSSTNHPTTTFATNDPQRMSSVFTMQQDLNINDIKQHNCFPRHTVRFSDGDTIDSDGFTGSGFDDDLYIPPMASNLIPFAVVPNTTPVHQYHSPQDVEQGGQASAAATNRDDPKRKTSSGKKMSLVSFVRGRRSDKVKEKDPDNIKHNRSLSLNRFSRVERLKQLQPQRSKEV